MLLEGWWPAAPVIAGVVSFVACWLIHATRSLHMVRTGRADTLSSVQAAHGAPTPRLGGLALVLGLVAAAALSADQFGWRAAALWASLVPLVAAGLLEDLGFGVRPAVRLAAAAVSSVLVVCFTGRWLLRFDAPLVDAAMAFAPLAIVVTVFATTAVSHAFNLIDGLNGLCAGVALTICIAFGAIAERAGDSSAVAMAQAFAVAIFGFFLWNYPFGRIFLGDAGAYALGHVLAWFAIVLIWRTPEVSAWAMLLLFLWPIADTTLAIWRRWRRGAPVAAPDNRHMHQVVLRFVETCWLGKKNRRLANPLATLLMAPFFVAPAVAGVALWDKPLWSFVAVVVFVALFVGSYALLVCAIRRWRRPALPADDETVKPSLVAAFVGR